MSTQQPSASDSSTSSSTSPAVKLEMNRHGWLEEAGNLRVSDWAKRWETGATGWHKQEVHPVLTTYLPSFACNTKQDRSILVPLCGKTVDMRWLYEQGWKVVGIEIVTQAIMEYFQGNSDLFPRFTVERLSGTSIYKYSTPDGRMCIYQADIMSAELTLQLMGFNSGSGFDAVWDRASLIAMNPRDRKAYVSSLSRWFHPHTEYLLSTIEYNTADMNGPPFSVPTAILPELFAEWKIESLESKPAKQDAGKDQQGQQKLIDVVNAAFKLKK